MKRKHWSVLATTTVLAVLGLCAAFAAGDSKSPQKSAPSTPAKASSPDDRVLQDPAAVKHATLRVAKSREEFELAIKKVKERMKVHNKLDWKAENETLETYRDMIIPWLRDERREILANKGTIMAAQTDYLDALERAIQALRVNEQRANAPNKAGGPSSKLVRSEKVQQHRVQLGAAAGTVAVKYLERHKDAEAAVLEVQEFLLMVEDCGSLLEEWEGIVLAMIEAGEKGDSALKEIQGLRDFARQFQDAFDSFLNFSEKLEYGTSSGGKPKA